VTRGGTGVGGAWSCAGLGSRTRAAYRGGAPHTIPDTLAAPVWRGTGAR
jgi:hypothetical protein